MLARAWTPWSRLVGPAGGIQRRLISLVAVACGAVALITGAALAMEWRALDRAAQIEARNLAMSLAQTMSAAHSPTLHFLPGSHGVDRRDVFVLDAGRRTRSSIVPAEVGSVYVQDKSAEIDQVLRDGIARSFTEISSQHPGGARFVAVPVRTSVAMDSPITGVLALESSRLSDQLIADSAMQLCALALSGLIVLLGVGMVGLRLASRLSASIGDLQAGVEDFAQGRLNRRMPLQGVAEVTALGRAFNAMAQALQQTTLELRLENELANEAAIQVERLAFIDPMTGLSNRASLSRLLSQQIAWAASADRGFALLILGLDRFRKVNDSLGHGVGDELLAALGERLQTTLGANHVLVRLGGDEFATLVQDSDAQALGSLARDLISAIAAPCRVRGNDLRMSASIGMAIYPSDGGDEESLMRSADIAMHQAKGDGGGGFAIYSDEFNRQSVERLAFEASLRQALDADALTVHYQPKVSTRTGLIEGVEALVRWQHPQLGMISPANFIAVAEETGLIVPLGRQVMRKAVEQLASWRALGLPDMAMAVNLSPAQLVDPGLLEHIDELLAATGVDPRLLELEITESVLMRDTQQTMVLLAAIKRRGLRLAVDDFGTGYSSLSHLRSFPVDTLKIDRSFVRGVAEDADDRAIVQAIMQMAQTLRLKVVAEGVETTAQRQALSKLGCDLLQGFLFSPALPPEELQALVRGQGREGVVAAQGLAICDAELARQQ